MNKKHSHLVILEDNEPDLLMIKTSIREAGVECEILSFDNGVEALEYVTSATSPIPDLVILDSNVPGVEGTVVLKGVRGNPRWAGVGVFMFTASQDPENVIRVTTLGANKCLIKPMDLDGFAKIGHAVSEWLNGRSARM